MDGADLDVFDGKSTPFKICLTTAHSLDGASAFVEGYNLSYAGCRRSQSSILNLLCRVTWTGMARLRLPKPNLSHFFRVSLLMLKNENGCTCFFTDDNCNEEACAVLMFFSMENITIDDSL